METKRILVSCSGTVAVFAVDEKGQCDGTGLNESGQIIHSVIRKHWGHGTLLIVEDCLFHTGYHRVTTYHGAGGAGWGFKLHPLMSEAENIAAHDAMVYASLGIQVLPKPKSGLSLAFDRLAKLPGHEGGEVY